MKLLALALLLALPAQAEPGFFRDPGDRTLARGGHIKATYACMTRILYHAPTPTAIELDYLSPTTNCLTSMRVALQTASKVFVLGEPAWDPNYECRIEVFWNPGEAPAVIYSGDSPCTPGRSFALHAAVNML
jgi:hypothetical protein